MAFFEVVTTIFSISTLLSLIMRKRVAPDEAEPSRPSRLTRSTSAGQERRSKRELDPRIPLERSLLPNISLDKFRNRKVVFEAHVDEKMFGTYPVIDFLLDQGWGPIFEAKTHASEGTVRTFYALIWNPLLKPLQFFIPLGRQEIMIGVDEIARVMSVEKGLMHASEKDCASKREKRLRTRFLCGQLEHWGRGTSLASTKMTNDFRLLYNICTYNVYL